MYKLLSAKAVGHFFQPDGEVGKCFGEYPPLFAVCSNGADLIDLLLAYITIKTDFPGNNIVMGRTLYTCVLCTIEMHDYILEIVGAEEYNRMMLETNKEGLSPFTLVATEYNSTSVNWGEWAAAP